MMCALALMLASTAAPKSAPLPVGYPGVAKAGFHHCALIYEKAVRDEANLKPYVAQWSDGHAKRWMFDAFLFLTAMTKNGIRTEYGETRLDEWKGLLDTWFGAGRDLAALDQAIDAASADLGAPPRKRQVMFCIPYANPAVHDFGDANGDGKTENLATATGRDAALRWYVAEAKRRFEAAHYRNLELWGYYWMREDMGPEDQKATIAASKACHDAGKRFFWIPWFNAPGWNIWQKLGFDVCIMQPNYAFVSDGHGGRIRRNRLAVDADMTRGKGLGVEMEAGDLISSPEDRRAFMHYLCDGAPSRLGYQAAPTAYYLDTDLVGLTAASADPQVAAMYNSLAGYIAGETIPDPDPRCSWSVAGKPYRFGQPGVPKVLEGRLGREQPIAELEVFLDEPVATKPWRGMVRVEGERLGQSGWKALGWALRSSPDTTSGRHQVLVVPVGADVVAMRVHFEPSSAESGVRLQAIGIKPASGEHPIDHLALHKPYTLTPRQSSKAKYDDDGTKLVDGVIPALGYKEHRSVGWLNDRVTVRFDLGSVKPVSQVQVFAQGGGAGAVGWPVNCTAYLCSQEGAPIGSSGPGTPPKGLTLVTPDPVKVIRRRGPTDLDGVLVFRSAKPAKARYVTICLEPDGWIMLTEVKVVSNGRNVAPEATYTLTPPPTREESADQQYLDDGLKLTDGQIAQGFQTPRLVGWQGSKPRVIAIDLEKNQPIGSITAWALRGGQAGIYAPQSIGFEVSEDGTHWSDAGKAVVDGPAEDGASCVATPLSVKLPAGTRGRWVRVTVTARYQWVMFSEIEVQPPVPGN